MTATRALTGNARDEGQLANATRVQKSRADRLADAWRVTLATREGRMVFQAVIDELNPLGGTVNYVESYGLLAFWNGQQNAGKFVLAQIELNAPGALVLMAQEKADEEEKRG